MKNKIIAETIEKKRSESGLTSKSKMIEEHWDQLII